MMGTRYIRNSFLLLLTVFAAAGGTFTGCDLFGGGLAPLPFGQITAVQLFDEPNFSVALSVESAVANPAALAKVNWVFGDGGGFEEGTAGRATITHRYPAPGDYEVTAFLFGPDGFVDQITSTITVAPNGDVDPDPDPDPDPDDLPGKVSGPLPVDEATDVSVDTMLSWISGVATDSHDVYFGKDATEVDGATTADDGTFKGNQTETSFDPEDEGAAEEGELLADTEYFWRVDEVNEFGTTKGEVFSFTTASTPEQAKDPTPSNGSTSARVDQVLQWVAGKDATTHDVFFGKDQTAVEDATTEDEDVFQGNQAATSFDPEDEDAEIDGQLLADTDYFWRIDELGAGGKAKGAVWSFRTAASPPKITSPVPTDMQTDVDVNQVLSWIADPSIESFDIYFGIDPVDVGNATTDSPDFKGNRTDPTFKPSPLTGATDFFWRIDSLGTGGTTRGDVFSFTTIDPPGQVTGPFTPADDAVSIDIGPELAWAVGGGGPTTSFTLYLSTDSNAVANAAASALRKTQDVVFTTLQLDSTELDPDTLYFWRVDATGPGGTTPGPVLSFATGSEPVQVDDPNPAIGAKGVSINVELQWSAAVGANSYGVFFGDSQAAVQNATDDDAESIGSTSTTAFSPGLLDGNTTYFWRIDSEGPGGTTQGDVWQFTTAPEPASLPTPTNGEMSVALSAMLNWTAGSGAVSHDVYFGDSLADVDTATTATPVIFKGNQPGASFDPSPDPTLLEGNKTFFWRIDEVDADNGTTKGEVWSFTTGPGQAAEPIDPADGATGVGLSPTLMWFAGDGAAFHDVYLGTDETAVDSATRGSAEFQQTQAVGDETFAPPVPLDPNTVHFWRIDEVTAADVTTKGEVWQFRTQTGQAADPMPEHQALGVDVNADLQWSAVASAASFDVYLGINSGDVDAATTADVSGIFRGNVTDTSFDPDTLMPATTYFWRIDTVGAGGTTKGDIWEFTTGAAQATTPSPANGASGVSISPTLDWLPDLANATGHDIYFGTSQSAVQDADMGSPEFQGTFDLVGAPPFNPGLLDGITFHFWRVDSVTADGTTQGEVWQFRTGPGKATNPSPANFALGVMVDTLLTWTGGVGAVSHDVYFGTSLADVTNATVGTPLGVFQGNVPGAIFGPGMLAGDTTFYWRIDSVAADGTTRTGGDVWRFTTLAPPAQAGSPSPFSGATDVMTDTSLSWGAADGATSYDVYFGTNLTAVTNATTADTEFQGNQSNRTFNPGALANATTYYWRIDPVNEAGTTTGAVWSFTTEP